jgi:Xaa-Pro aminopeptidase
MQISTEIQQRVSRFKEMLRGKGVQAALLLMPVDIYYFTGTRQNSALWIPADGQPMLLVRKSFVRAREESPIADIRPFPSSKDLSTMLGEAYVTVGMTFDAVPVQQHVYYSKVLPGRNFVDISKIIRELRSVKSSAELELLRISAEKFSSVLREVPTFIREGMRELDLAAELEYRLRRIGHEGFVRMRAFNQEICGGVAVASSAMSYGFFDGPVSGKGLSSASPQGASLDEIRAHVPILIDFVGVFNGYMVDMTRIFVIGSLDAELQRAFDVSLDIQEVVRQAMVPGAICEDIYRQAVSMAEKAGLGGNFMGMPGEQSRFVGHGVGLELDELPVLAPGFSMPLIAGQVVAVEPKFVIPGKGVVGIENTFVVTEHGGDRLSDLPDGIVTI